MKNIKLVIVAACVFALHTTSSAQVSNPDSMVKKIFSTLQSKDEGAFVALFPATSQMKVMVKEMMQKMMNNENFRQMMMKDPNSKNLNVDSLINAEVDQMDKPEVQAGMVKSFKESYNKIIQKGEKKGVVWGQAKLTNYTIDTTAGSGSMEDQMMGGAGFKTMKGVIDFTIGDSAYQIAYNKVIFIPSAGGWFGVEFAQLAKKGESLEPDQEPDLEFMGDIKTIDTAYKMPDVPVKSENKKVPAKTKTDTKPKSKTPARKTGTKS